MHFLFTKKDNMKINLFVNEITLAWFILCLMLRAYAFVGRIAKKRLQSKIIQRHTCKSYNLIVIILLNTNS